MNHGELIYRYYLPQEDDESTVDEPVAIGSVVKVE